MDDEKLKAVAHLVKTDVIDKLKMDGGAKLTFLDYLFHELAEDEGLSATAYTVLFCAGMVGIHGNEDEEEEDF